MKKQVVYALISVFVVAGIIFVSSVNLDLNHDGTINITDLQLIASHFQGKGSYNVSYDFNNNSKIDLYDLVAVARQVGTTVNNGSNESGNVSMGNITHTHEPAGYTAMTERSFDTIDEGTWTHTSDTYCTIVNDSDPEDGSAGRSIFPAGWPAYGAEPPCIIRYYESPEPSSIYMYFTFKISSNWYGNDDSGINKVIYLKDATYAGGGDPGILLLYGVGNNALHWRVAVQGNLNRNMDANTTMSRGQWHTIEALLTMNSAGSASDGVAKLWQDGQLVINQTNVRWEDSTGSRLWYGTPWEPIYGGAGTVPVPSEMYQEIGYMYISYPA